MEQSSPTPSEQPESGNRRQERVCNVLTLIGLVAFIVVGAVNIFAPEAEAAPEETTEEAVLPAATPVTAESFDDAFNEAPSERPKAAAVDTIPADSVTAAAPSDSLAAPAGTATPLHHAPHDSATHHHHEVPAATDSI